MTQRMAENITAQRFRERQLTATTATAAAERERKARAEKLKAGAKVEAAETAHQNTLDLAEFKSERKILEAQKSDKLTGRKLAKHNKEMKALDLKIANAEKAGRKLDKELTAAGTGSDKFIKEYRQWYSDATSEAMQRLKLNRPDQLTELAAMMTAIQTGDMTGAAQAEGNLARTMTPEQYTQYQSFIREGMTRGGVPSSISKYFESTFETPEGTETTEVVTHEPTAITTPTGTALPKNPKTNVQVTWQDILDLAEDNEITTDEVLVQLGVAQ